MEEDRREKDGRIRIFAGGTMLVIENGVLLSCEGECEGTLEIPPFVKEVADGAFAKAKV